MDKDGAYIPEDVEAIKGPVLSRPLAPLPYHHELREFVERNEPEIWAWSTGGDTDAGADDDTREALLRETYRLSRDGHPEVYADCDRALAILDLEASVTVYQATDGAMNASMYFVPGEIHLTLFGPVLEKLSQEERLALIGHELAHYRLWHHDEGAFRTLAHIFEHAQAYHEATPSHLESARLLRLHTELYADRGAALVAGSMEPAISTLVKTMTGMAKVDAAEYLKQAAELERSAKPSEANSHPETYVRAQALAKWWSCDPEVDDWIEKMLFGPISLERLDLTRQARLTQMTRDFLSHFPEDPELRSDEVLAQIGQYSPERPKDEHDRKPGAPAWDEIDDSVREFLTAVIFDIAMADRDVRDEILAAGVVEARAFGGTAIFEKALAKDLKIAKSKIKALMSDA